MIGLEPSWIQIAYILFTSSQGVNLTWTLCRSPTERHPKGGITSNAEHLPVHDWKQQNLNDYVFK